MYASTVFSVINIAPFSFGAILVCLTCLVYMMLHGRFEKAQSKLLMAIVVVLAVNSLCSLTAEVFKPYMQVSESAAFIAHAANYLYFVSHTPLAPMVCMYFLTVCGRTTKRRGFVYIMTALPFFVTELLVIINPLTHWVYYYTADQVFTRNWAMYVIYAVAAYYILFGLYALFRGWRALTTVKRCAIIYFFLMVCFGVVAQLLEPTVRIELFAESVALLGIMLFVENEDDLIDAETGVYNRTALKTHLDSFVNARFKTYVIVVRVINADSFTRIAGSTQARQHMVSAVASHIRTLEPWYRIYRTAPAQYALFDSSVDEQGALDLARKISARFDESWDYLGADIDLHAVITVALVPDDLRTANNVLFFIDSPVPITSGKKVLERSDLGYLLRRVEVERAVQQGLTDSNYEVYYQPIFDADGVARGAEALMRLHDPELGDVPPDEFIAVAEQIGFIEGIGNFALREVCAFLASGIPQRLGIKRICVNLSVIQCMRADLPARIRETVREFGINPQELGFEITESVAAGNYEFLDRMMHQLKEDGHIFSMDDYGTGYSNMHSLVALDFQTVKIDKGVLWDAEKSETGRAILENSVSLVRNIGSKVLVEGVETEDQVALLKQLGVDYLQGFHFTKPLPKDGFVSFVEQHRV